MIYCQYCGTPQEDNTRFCSNCGGNLTPPAYNSTAPQQPQHQAPQYQQPQYQAPQYQQPAYQYQQPYGGYNPMANRAAAKKPATTAMVLCIIAMVLQIVALVMSDFYYTYYMGVSIPMNLTSYITAIVRFGICAIFPFLVKRAASSSDPRAGKSLHTGAVCFLCVQVVGVLACFAGWLMMRFGAPGMFYSIINTIFGYVAGSNLISSLVGLIYARKIFLVSSVLHTSSALCYWIGSILTLSAAAKLKKS